MTDSPKLHFPYLEGLEQPDYAITWEWAHVERPCRCTPEHRPFCHRCGGTGIVRLARLRRVDSFDGVVVNPPFQASEGEVTK